MAKDRNDLPTLIDEMEKLRDVTIQVGPIGDPDVLPYAGVQEFGATIKVSQSYRNYVFAMGYGIPDEITIPERSYLRSSFDDKKTMGRIMDEALPAVADLFNGRGGWEDVADQIGKTMVEIIQEKIQSNIGPANHAVTIALKGHGNTLLDTGALFQSIEARY